MHQKQIQRIVNGLNEMNQANNSHKFNLMMIHHLNYAPEVYSKILVEEAQKKLKPNLNEEMFIKQLCEVSYKEQYKKCYLLPQNTSSNVFNF